MKKIGLNRGFQRRRKIAPPEYLSSSTIVVGRDHPTEEKRGGLKLLAISCDFIGFPATEIEHRIPIPRRLKLLAPCSILPDPSSLSLADLIEKHNDEIAALETWDNGKPYEQDVMDEVPMLVRLIRYYVGWADKIHGLVVPVDGPHHVQVLHEPISVFGQIIPWNFTLLMYAWKVRPALACGNTIVLKTAE